MKSWLHSKTLFLFIFCCTWNAHRVSSRIHYLSLLMQRSKAYRTDKVKFFSEVDIKMSYRRFWHRHSSMCIYSYSGAYIFFHISIHLLFLLFIVILLSEKKKKIDTISKEFHWRKVPVYFHSVWVPLGHHRHPKAAEMLHKPNSGQILSLGRPGKGSQSKPHIVESVVLI